MHTTIDTTTLRQALEIVGRVSTKHVTLPVLQCVLLQAEKGQLLVKATNLEIAVEVGVSAEVESDGVVAVPATTLTQTVALLSEKTVTLSLEGEVLTVQGTSSQTSINTMATDEFPTLPKITGQGQVLNGALFSLGLKTVGFAASLSSIKPELGSVDVVQTKEHTLTFVATDSFRLMEKTVSQKGVVLDEALLIPQKNAQEVSRICDLVGEDPELRVGDGQCSLVFPGGVSVTTRLTNGSFPDYVQIIPKEFATRVTVLKSDLVQAFKRTNIFLNKFMQVSFHVTKEGLSVSAQNADVGNTTESIKAQVEGEELGLNFNQRYVAEALAHFADDSVVLRFAGVGRPLVIEGVSETSVRYLVMPMNK